MNPALIVRKKESMNYHENNIIYNSNDVFG